MVSRVDRDQKRANCKSGAFGRIRSRTDVRRTRGQIVAPGFIDVHTHVENIYKTRRQNFVRMGVTSLITGNCGGSELDVKEFLGRMKPKPIAVNLGTLVGHNSMRSKAMGLDDRPPTAEEQAK